MVVTSGCQQPVDIRQYEVPKPPHRMLGAMVFRGQTAWFFKVTGPREGLGQEAEKFEQFVRSIRFGEGADDGPQWDLPAGWTDQGASELRYRTITLPAGDETCELSVTRLPIRSGSVDAYRLDNINRWRGQIRLWSLVSDELPHESREVELAGDTKATLVDLVGTLEPKPRNRPAMDMGLGMGHGQLAGPPATPPPATNNLKYKLPEGWQQGEQSQFSKLAFEVRDGPQRVKITVTDLAAAGNQLLDNVNRWRQMVQQEPVAEAELAKHLRSIQVGDVSGSYVEINSPADSPKPQTILGVVAYRGDLAWFVKLQGDASLAGREKSHFEEFVQSLQF